MNNDYAIEVHQLRKVFDEKVAVANLTLSVERGEVFGFLGPNGAGKTTSVKMLLGLIAPTSGEGSLFGRPLGDPLGRAKVGFLPEHFRFHGWLKAWEFLQLHADLYRIPRDVTRHRIPELLALVGLEQDTNRKLRTFSKGMLQRVGLAQALLNKPDLVFLDEPTSGLDPVGRRLVRDIIRNLRERGTSIFLNSHLLSEVEITCDRVAFINHGEIVRTTDLHTAAGQSLIEGSGVNVEIRARLQPGTADASATVADGHWTTIMTGLQQWTDQVRLDGELISLFLPDESGLPDINRYLVAHNVDVYTITPKKTSLEDLFIQLVGEEHIL